MPGIVALAAGVAISLFAGAPAVAAEPPDRTLDSTTCALGTAGVPLNSDRQIAESPRVDVACYRTFAEAFATVTGIELDPGTTALSIEEVDRLLSLHPEAARRDSVLLGIAYIDINQGGASQLYYGTGGCYGVTFGFPTLSSGWDNAISSATQVNGCWATYYEHTSYDPSGMRINCPGYCASMSLMNDRTSSIVFRPVGTYG